MRSSFLVLIALVLLAAGGWWLTRNQAPNDPAGVAGPGPAAGIPEELDDEGSGALQAGPEEPTRSLVSVESEPPPETAPSAVQTESALQEEDGFRSEEVRILARVLQRGTPAVQRPLGLDLHWVDSAQAGSTSAAPSTSDDEGNVEFNFTLWEGYEGTFACLVVDQEDGRRGWALANHEIGFSDPEADEPRPQTFDLGDIEIATPRDNYRDPLVTGWIFDELGALIPDVRCEVQFMPKATPTSGGLEDTLPSDPRAVWLGQVVLEANGAFAVYGGPSQEGVLMLTTSAPGFHSSTDYPVKIPTSDYEIELSRPVTWRGQLIVPEDGPPVFAYGAWMSNGGLGGSGVPVQFDGSFQATGSLKTTELRITYPQVGCTLWQQDVLPSSMESGERIDVGEIDLSDQVVILDLVLEAADGTGLDSIEVTCRLPAEWASIPPRVRTDARGRFLAVFPRMAEWVDLVGPAGESHRIDLSAPPARLVFQAE